MALKLLFEFHELTEEVPDQMPPFIHSVIQRQRL